MFGAWGKATTNGQTVQLRALDWVNNIDKFRTSMDHIKNTLWQLYIILLHQSSEILG
jgi:hypothetical protein